jgi:hypothetical protein
MAGDDLGLGEDAQELGQQQQHGRHRDEGEGDGVGAPVPDRPPESLDQPPRPDERHRDHAAGDVHREDAH